MQAWVVCYMGCHLDTVYMDESATEAEVKKGLVDHDGYDSRITLRRGGPVPQRAVNPRTILSRRLRGR